jgi:hypothetical protein
VDPWILLLNGICRSVHHLYTISGILLLQILQRENMKFTYFVKGGEGDRLPAVKERKIFIGILEGIHPEDAELVSRL